MRSGAKMTGVGGGGYLPVGGVDRRWDGTKIKRGCDQTSRETGRTQTKLSSGRGNVNCRTLGQKEGVGLRPKSI